MCVFEVMAVECPECRTVIQNNDAPYCIACGLSLRGLKPKSRDPWRSLGIVAPVGIILVLVIAQRHC